MTHAVAAQEAASRTAVQVDAVFVFIAVVSLFFFLLVEGMLVWFAVRYRRRKGEEAAALSDVRSNTLLETIWIVIPSLVVVAFFYYGYVVFRDMQAPRPGAGEINVTARQFSYEFLYPDGRKAVNELRVPEGRPVKLVMISSDVLHGFFIPDYRIKQGIVPGQYTTLWLSPDKAGTFDIFCTQYCGVGHSTMRARLVVMPPAEYAQWAASGKAGAGVPTADRGKELLESSGCLGCHSADGTPKVGPTFKGLFGRKVVLADGRTIEADEEYIRESLLDPGAKVVKGFPNIMPTFKGTLSDDDVAAVVAHVKTLK
ncbi:MAG: cytochrome c oxidase subunit II [Deltaproteobacteria bacterium]